jgi:hypothetical protein
MQEHITTPFRLLLVRHNTSVTNDDVLTPSTSGFNIRLHLSKDLSSVPALPFGLQGWGVDTDYRLPFPGVVAHHLSDFQG